jgi:glycosyltransferase involved in cell wall biosynthesis
LTAGTKERGARTLVAPSIRGGAGHPNMDKLLTISIPTYNRAALLDRQLAWFARAVRGHEASCELVVLDNCSPDDTPAVVAKWQEVLGKTLSSVRHPTNIGLVPNVVRCFGLAKGRYAWTIGDDDPIEDGAIEYVVRNLLDHPELSYLNLNQRWYDEPHDTVVHERFFDIERDEVVPNGKAVIESLLASHFPGLAFLSAQVYRTDAVQAAVRSWPESTHNLEGQVYWSAFCALQGSVKFSRDVFVTYTCGTNDLAAPRYYFKCHYNDLPRVYARLPEIGYDAGLCRRAILGLVTGEGQPRTVLGAIRRWPLHATRVLTSYIAIAARASLRRRAEPAPPAAVPAGR